MQNRADGVVAVARDGFGKGYSDYYGKEVNAYTMMHSANPQERAYVGRVVHVTTKEGEPLATGEIAGAAPIATAIVLDAAADTPSALDVVGLAKMRAPNLQEEAQRKPWVRR